MSTSLSNKLKQKRNRNQDVLGQGIDRVAFGFGDLVVKQLLDEEDDGQMIDEQEAYQFCIDNNLTIAKYIPKMTFIKKYTISERITYTPWLFCKRFCHRYRQISDVWALIRSLEESNFEVPLAKDIDKIVKEANLFDLSICDMTDNSGNFMLNVEIIGERQIAHIYFVDLGLMMRRRNNFSLSYSSDYSNSYGTHTVYSTHPSEYTCKTYSTTF